MTNKISEIFVVLLQVLFLVGSSFLFAKFFAQPNPEFIIIGTFLLFILCIIMFHDKLDELSASLKGGIKLKLKDRIIEEQTAEEMMEITKKAHNVEILVETARQNRGLKDGKT